MNILRASMLLLAVLFCAAAGAQGVGKHTSTFGQHVPPFARDKPMARVYNVEGEDRTIPSFRLSPAAFGLNLVDLSEDDLAFPNRLPVLQGLRGEQFDFGRALPHLAFFCRVEINEAANAAIPMRFRLGGHRYWQDNLLRAND